MCGRYLDLDGKEIFPWDTVSIDTSSGELDKRWGIINEYRKAKVINARSERIHYLSLFKDMDPCIIRALGYFEWDKEKKKYLFSNKDKSPIYMAGLYKQEGFVIITADAYDKYFGIHPRMPFILPKENLSLWINKKELLRDQAEYDFYQV